MKVRSHISTSCPRASRRSSGFALLVSLLLMMLIGVLALGMLSVASVTLRRSDAEQATAEARANARLAVSIAVGELQKHAGPDRRVTARGDIIAAKGEDPASGQKWLTGVWRTEEEPLSEALGRDLRLRRVGRSPAYLVSGNEQFDPDRFTQGGSGYPAGYFTPGAREPASGTVGLGRWTVDGKDREVRAPLMTISSSGSYAYWVEDEGAKARVDLTNSLEASSSSGDRAAAAALGHRNRADWIAAGSSEPDATGRALRSLPQEGGSPLWGKLVSYDSIVLHGGDVGAVRSDLGRLSSDLTNLSRSLLTDMQRGGFRRDLTAAFRNSSPSSLIGSVFDSLLVYPQQGTPADGENGEALCWRPGGVPWPVLQDYAAYAGRITSRTAAQDVRLSTGTNGRNPSAVSQFCPVLNRVQMFFDVSYEEAGGGNYNVMFHLFPMVVLWNPYDQPMRVPAFKMDLTANENASAGWYELAFDYQLQGAYTVVGPPAPQIVEFKPLRFFSSRPVEIPPGKSIILTTPKRHVAFNSSGSGQELVSEWQDGFGLFYKGMTVNFTAANPPAIRVTKRKLVSNDFGGGVRLYSDELGLHLAGLAWDIDDAADAAGSFIPQLRPAAAPLTGPSTPRWGGILSRKLVENQLQPLASPSDANGYPARALAAYNVRAHHYSNVGKAAKTPPQFITGTLRAGTDVASYVKPQIANASSGSGPHYTFCGGSDLRGAGHCVLFHVPRSGEPILSLAQFSHATLVRPYNKDFHRGSNVGEDLEPSYPIGNSIRPPHHPPDQIRVNTSSKPDWVIEYKGVAANAEQVYRGDASFLYNNALWDTYYLSGWDPDRAGFLNARLKLRAADAKGTALVRTDALRGLSNVYLDGGFNVNSTSKAAWKALLASTVGIRPSAAANAADKPGYNRIPDPVTSFRTLDSGCTPTSADSYENDARILDEASLDRLATRLVEQVKLRGPFPTLSAFVNRTLVPGSLARPGVTSAEVSNEGALQAALDGTGSENDVNGQLSRANWVAESDLDSAAGLYQTSVIGHVFPEAAAGARGYGAPMYLLPSDILAKIGPFLTGRSDTFTVRAYGESRDAAGAVRARARCEVVVQREPDWVGGQLDPTATPPAGGVEDRFGRAFRVVSFRWLNPQN